jgi:hypothetical protein
VRTPVLVSNHPVDPSGAALITRLGTLNVRMMYAVGKAGWNLSWWNRLYDAVLCFGPYHAEALGAFPAAKLQVGYPRFDAFFSLQEERDALLRRFDCDPERRTVVWLPTWKSLSSVGHYDDVIASLRPRFNVVLKLHPLMASEQPEIIAAVRTLGLNHVIADATDNIPLYVIADWILCDYGGPAFGAIHADRNLLLLNVPGAADDELTGKDSPDIRLRETIVNVSPDTRWRIEELLDDENVWLQQQEVRRTLRRTYFAPNEGNASEAAAACLRDIESIVRDVQG